MAYEPTNWKKGDVVTAAKLNHLENGIADGAGELIVHLTENDGTWSADQTFADIDSTYQNGRNVRVMFSLEMDGGGVLFSAPAVFRAEQNDMYAIAFQNVSSPQVTILADDSVMVGQ